MRTLVILFALLISVVSVRAGIGNDIARMYNSNIEFQETETLPYVLKAGEKAPDFEVTMFDGQKIVLSELHGKTVHLMFWATWCPPCRAELKRVEKEIIERYEGEDFVFLPISRGETREKVGEFRLNNNYNFPMGLDPDESIYKKYAEKGVPRNFVIDKNGTVVLSESGYTEEKFAELINVIQKTLKTK